MDILAQGYPASREVTCDNTATTLEITETASVGGSNLSYDALADQYVYAWKTDKAWVNTCRELNVRLADGTDHKALFEFRK